MLHVQKRWLCFWSRLLNHLILNILNFNKAIYIEVCIINNLTVVSTFMLYFYGDCLFIDYNKSS